MNGFDSEVWDVTISPWLRQQNGSNLYDMNEMYKLRIIVAALSMFIVNFPTLKAGSEATFTVTTSEILAEQDGSILVNTNVTGSRLVLKEDIPSEVIFKITNNKGDLLMTGKSTDRVINIKGLAKGSYFVEINLDGEPVKQMFSVLY